MENKEYKELLKDPRWQKMKALVMIRDNFTCQHCGATDKTLHVHHFNYDAPTPWDVPDQYLITLCEDCHNAWHNKLFGLRKCDQRTSECEWWGFDIERLRKEGFLIDGNMALLKVNGYTLYITHQGIGSNCVKADLFKEGYKGGKKLYHEDFLVTHLMLDDYLEDYLDYKPWEREEHAERKGKISILK